MHFGRYGGMGVRITCRRRTAACHHVRDRRRSCGGTACCADGSPKPGPARRATFPFPRQPNKQGRRSLLERHSVRRGGSVPGNHLASASTRLLSGALRRISLARHAMRLPPLHRRLPRSRQRRVHAALQMAGDPASARRCFGFGAGHLLLRLRHPRDPGLGDRRAMERAQSGLRAS